MRAASALGVRSEFSCSTGGGVVRFSPTDLVAQDGNKILNQRAQTPSAKGWIVCSGNRAAYQDFVLNSMLNPDFNQGKDSEISGNDQGIDLAVKAAITS